MRENLLLLFQRNFLLLTLSWFLYCLCLRSFNLIIIRNRILWLLIYYKILGSNRFIFHLKLLTWLVGLGNSECLSYISAFDVAYVVNVCLRLDVVRIVYNSLYLFRCRDRFYELNILRFLVFINRLLIYEFNKLIINFNISNIIIDRGDWILWLTWDNIEIFKWPTLIIQ